MSRETAMVKFFGSRQAWRENLRLEARRLRGFGLTQQEIANILGVPQRTISFWLGGIAKPLSEDIAKRDGFSNNGSYPFSNNGALVPQLLVGRYEEVIRRRYVTKRPLLVATNKDIKDIKEFSEPIISRFHELGKMVLNKGRDYQKEKQCPQ